MCRQTNAQKLAGGWRGNEEAVGIQLEIKVRTANMNLCKNQTKSPPFLMEGFRKDDFYYLLLFLTLLAPLLLDLLTVALPL
jgi:hypothetical protein